MPFSTSKFKREIRDHIIGMFPSRETTILDVGAGAGTYFDLLGDHYPSIDAVEVWAPYVERFGLEAKYRTVYGTDALSFFRNNADLTYDVAIFGDVLEHMTPVDAVSTIAVCRRRCSYMVVVVPFGCEQGEVDGNAFERHLQPDLDFATMEERYGNHLELLMHGFHSSDRDYEIAVYRSRTPQAARCAAHD